MKISSAIMDFAPVRAAAAAFRSWRIEARNRHAFNAMGEQALSDLGITRCDLQCAVAGTFVRGGWISETPITFTTHVRPASNDAGRPSPVLHRHRP
jgi:uncharacterized protein YjiS (DUF1127 family)